LLETNALPGGSHLDAVSVLGVPEPSVAALLGLAMLGGGEKKPPLIGGAVGEPGLENFLVASWLAGSMFVQ